MVNRLTILSRLFMLCLIVIACEDDDSAIRPAFIDPVTPISDIIYLDGGPYFVSVRVTNDEGNPLHDIGVNFSLKQGEADLLTNQTKTDANGVAYTYLTANSNSDPVILEVSASGLSKKTVFTYGISKSRTSQILITGGNNRDVGAGIEANTPLSVKVMDDLGNVAAGASVKFVVLSGNGQVSSGTATTDENGEASTAYIGSTSSIINTIAAVVGTDSAFFELESIYNSSLSINTTVNSYEVKWSKSSASRFQKYNLQRLGPDGIYKQLAVITGRADTAYTDSDPALIVNELYMYRLTVHTPSASVETEVGTVFGKSIQLQGIAIDFEVDESRNQLYVSLPELNQIHIFDLTTYELKEKVVVGSKPHGISLSRDKSTLYVALNGSGAVAFMNMETKQVSQIDVSAEMGDLRVFDVLEGAPGRVFVTGSPESYGIAYLLVIKTEENNTVERFMNQVVRNHPVLATDYGKFIYVLNNRALYKLDPHGTYTDFSQEADYGFSFDRRFLIINPSGTKLYLDFEAINTNPISPAGTIGASVPALSPDGSVVHYHAGSMIRSYNTDTLEEIKETGFFVNYLRKLELRSDNSTFIALGVDYDLPGNVVYFIPNR